MRLSKALVALGMVALAIPALADAPGSAWVRTVSPDGAFSVETACSPESLERMKSLPSNVIKGVDIAADKRVVCMQENLLMVAGTIGATDLPPNAGTLFDAVMASAKGDDAAEGAPTLTSIDGRRAFVNRQTQGSVVAQTGFVEAGPTKIVLLVAGGSPKGTLSVAEQGAAIDRFYKSIRVSAR